MELTHIMIHDVSGELESAVDALMASTLGLRAENGP
jgi:hypothetical protein